MCGRGRTILTGYGDGLWLGDDVGLLSVGEGRGVWAVGDVLRDDNSGPVLLWLGLGDRWRGWSIWCLVVGLVTWSLWSGRWAVDSVDWLGHSAWAVC